MQLRLSNPFAATVTHSGFKQNISAILAGITLTGAFSTVIFNSSAVSEKANVAFQAVSEVFEKSPFYEGIRKVGGTIKDWGAQAFSAKDDFKEWIYSYLNPSGFKSGALSLYEKLIHWLTIVYEWFRDKFLEFIQNIPKMVENWKKLRFSLFKWGTFLGGGGASAIWAMFGNADNWGRLAELMGNKEFAGAVEKLGELIEKNPEAFEGMTEEEKREIMEKIMENPEEAKESAEELLKEQEENKKKNEEEKELDKEKILEEYSGKKGGKPKTPEQALSGFISAGLNGILSGKNAFKGAFVNSREAMLKHLDILEKESSGNTESAKIKKEFVETIKAQKEEFLNTFARLSEQAYQKYDSWGSKKPELLTGIFKDLMKKEFTVEALTEEEADASKMEELLNELKVKSD